MTPMTKEQVKEILDRVLSWPREDQEKVARFARQVEQWRGADDITDEEWKIIEERAARRDLASDEDVEQVFSRYRRACNLI
jgi:thioredoxin-like negative regulator of GroEL